MQSDPSLINRSVSSQFLGKIFLETPSSIATAPNDYRIKNFFRVIGHFDHSRIAREKKELLFELYDKIIKILSEINQYQSLTHETLVRFLLKEKDHRISYKYLTIGNKIDQAKGVLAYLRGGAQSKEELFETHLDCLLEEKKHRPYFEPYKLILESQAQIFSKQARKFIFPYTFDKLTYYLKKYSSILSQNELTRFQKIKSRVDFFKNWKDANKLVIIIENKLIEKNYPLYVAQQEIPGEFYSQTKGPSDLIKIRSFTIMTPLDIRKQISEENKNNLDYEIEFLTGLKACDQTLEGTNNLNGSRVFLDYDQMIDSLLFIHLNYLPLSNESCLNFIFEKEYFATFKKVAKAKINIRIKCNFLKEAIEDFKIERFNILNRLGYKRLESIVSLLGKGLSGYSRDVPPLLKILGSNLKVELKTIIYDYLLQKITFYLDSEPSLNEKYCRSFRAILRKPYSLQTLQAANRLVCDLETYLKQKNPNFIPKKVTLREPAKLNDASAAFEEQVGQKRESPFPINQENENNLKRMRIQSLLN